MLTLWVEIPLQDGCQGGSPCTLVRSLARPGPAVRVSPGARIAPPRARPACPRAHVQGAHLSIRTPGAPPGQQAGRAGVCAHVSGTLAGWLPSWAKPFLVPVRGTGFVD